MPIQVAADIVLEALKRGPIVIASGADNDAPMHRIALRGHSHRGTFERDLLPGWACSRRAGSFDCWENGSLYPRPPGTEPDHARAIVQLLRNRDSKNECW